MRTAAQQAFVTAGAMALAMLIATPVVLAQDARSVVPSGWHVRHVRVVGHRGSAPDDAVGGRSLTVRKPFAPPAADDDVFTESGTVYGNVAAFVPEPRIDSGVQFPYGFDGVGGYGSDIGFSAGNDSDVYDRGALDQSRVLRLGVQ